MLISRLYKFTKQHLTTSQLENFLSEAFAGILSLDHELFTIFSTKFLHLPDTEFKISTQAFYSHKGSNNFVDIKISNSLCVCFIENKVEAVEGPNQLDRYSEILKTFYTNIPTYLVYLTKYREEKTSLHSNFIQTTWFDVATFLSTFNKTRKSEIISDFLNFLEEINMGPIENFTLSEMSAMTYWRILAKKVTYILDEVKPYFKDFVGSRITDTLDNLIQIRDSDRYIYYKKNIIGTKGWTEIMYGFYLEEYPYIFVHIYCDSSNEEHKKLIHLAKESDLFPIHTDNHFALSTPLFTFLESENMMEDIISSFKEKIDIFRKFKEETKTLDWKI